MILSIPFDELSFYITKQLNFYFPDKFEVSKNQLDKNLKTAISRLDFCFSKVVNRRYNTGSTTIYNHLYSDHNVLLYWFLANTVWEQSHDTNLASKLYYLNKSMHGFDCMYDTKLPDIFLVFHGVGTMLGKASYGNFFVAMQGCTVGSHKERYPVFGKGVSLTANSSVIGNCSIGNRCSISAGTQLFEKNMNSDETAFMNPSTGILQIKQSKESYGKQFFNEEFFID